MIRILNVKTYSGFILDNPILVFTTGMTIIKFHYVPCYNGVEMETISVRVYKKFLTIHDIIEYQMGEWLSLKGFISIDEDNCIKEIDESDRFLMII